MKKTCLIRINETEPKWLDVYDSDIGYEWTNDRKKAFAMTEIAANMRITTVRRQFPNAIVEKI